MCNFYSRNDLPRDYNSTLFLVKVINSADIDHLKNGALYSTDENCKAEANELKALNKTLNLSFNDTKYCSCAFATFNNITTLLAYGGGSPIAIKIKMNTVMNDAFVLNGDWGDIAHNNRYSELRPLCSSDLNDWLTKLENNRRHQVHPCLHSEYAECRVTRRLAMRDVEGFLINDGSEKERIKDLLSGGDLSCLFS